MQHEMRHADCMLVTPVTYSWLEFLLAAGQVCLLLKTEGARHVPSRSVLRKCMLGLPVNY